MRKWLGMALLLLLSVLAGTAAGDTFCIEDPAAAQQGLVITAGYVSLQIPLEEAAQVRLEVLDANGSCQYQRDYGLQQASFRTEEIYLRLSGVESSYTIGLTVGDAVYAIPVTRRLGTLTNQPACGTGYPLDELTGQGSWQCATILDLEALLLTPVETPLLAAGVYGCGTLRFEIVQQALIVTASIPGGSISGGTVYVATDALTAEGLGSSRFEGSVLNLDQAFPTEGARYAVVYADLRVSFTPADGAAAPEAWLPGQKELWETMKEETISEAIG